MDSALKMLHPKTMKIGSDPETGLVTVSADTKDKKLSRDIVIIICNNWISIIEKKRLPVAK
jgi:hypothetical protein